MTQEEAAEIVLAGYKETCPWCDGIGELREPDGSGARCVVCRGDGYLVRDEWFTAQKVLGNGSFIIPGRLLSEAHRTYDLKMALRLRRMTKR